MSAARADIRDVEQLALIDVPPVPKLTDRQQRALDFITAAGWDGLSSDELGAKMHDHGDDDRCQWCGTTGNELGRRLRADGLVKQSRRTAPGGDAYMVWIPADAKKPRAIAPIDDDPFPEGF